MKFIERTNAENYRDRASESLMIVLLEGYHLVTTRKEATRLEKLGYEVF